MKSRPPADAFAATTSRFTESKYGEVLGRPRVRGGASTQRADAGVGGARVGAVDVGAGVAVGTAGAVQPATPDDDRGPGERQDRGDAVVAVPSLP